MSSRKFQIAIAGMVLATLGYFAAHWLVELAPLFGTYVASLCSLAGMYKASNVIDGITDSRKGGRQPPA